MARPFFKTVAAKPIFWILVVAFLLRLWGIAYGFPLFLVNDEPALVLGALKMMELKTLVPAWHDAEFRKVLSYPPVPSYFYLVTLAPVIAAHWALSGFLPLAAYADAIALDPSVIWIAARILNALMGIGVIFIIYRIARTVTRSERAALLAACFLAVSFYHIQLSQVVRQWMPATLFLYAAWLVALKFRDAPSKKPYLLAGSFMGLAIGTNTSSAVAFLPLLVSHFAARGQAFLKKLTSRELWLMVAVAAAIAILVTALYPFGFTRAEGSGTVFGDIAKRVGFLAGRSFAEWCLFLADYAKLLIRYETILLAATAVGIGVLIRRRASSPDGAPQPEASDRPIAEFTIAAILFSIVYLSALYLFFNEIPRALIFILPALAVLAGFGADRLISFFQNTIRPVFATNTFLIFGFSFFIFFAYPLAIDLRYDYLLSRQDTRLVARDWIEQNIPAGTEILADLPYLRLTNTKAGIHALEKIDPGGLRAADRALLRRDDAHYPTPAYAVLNLHFVSTPTPEHLSDSASFFRSRGFRYLVVEYEYTDQSDLTPQTHSLIRGLRLVKRVTPFAGREFDRALDISGEIATVPPLALFQFERFGQIVDVYAL